ncbi:MAG: S-adenosylmethionine:tRNA ribosyltransferase-isomerase [Bacteroidales bacterium]|nr:S-adenosylmethionine:tRNA ribosyltransferase-isomerase [Bacteroidales bacterium]
MLNDLKDIQIADYDYTLPDECIARYPLEQRDQSKLLALKNGEISEHHFYDLPNLLPPQTMLVFNNTRVIHARLLFRKPSGATVEVFCLEPHAMPVVQAFEQRQQCTWLCLVGNNKRWKEGVLTIGFKFHGEEHTLSATRLQPEGDAWTVRFNWSGGMSFAEAIEAAGVIPLPPYLGRAAEDSDSRRYQTVYARHDGSVAAPTAGLHFTPAVLEALKANAIDTEYITLHVGAGTFKPVSTPTIGEHVMHSEPVHVTIDNLRHIAEHEGNPVIAVGTTSVRTLESLYWFGESLQRNPNPDNMEVEQWQPYQPADSLPTYAQAYHNIIDWMERRNLDSLDGRTRLMIAPGYTYRVISGLVTNFHQPKSTLLLLVSALIGDRWHQCYQYALDHEFRFLSYGDSCLFIPQ